LFRRKTMSCEQQWRAAISWVHSNNSLVRQIAAPYFKYMASGSKDIEQEAILTAFSTLSILAQKGEHSSRFGAYFRILFRTRCIKMANCGMVFYFDDIEEIPTDPFEETINEIDHELVEQALQKMSPRQRRISRWILDQPVPISTTVIAGQFGIRSRTVRYILCDAIKRVEKTTYADTPVR